MNLSKGTVRRVLAARGWYLRRTAGLSAGIDLRCDLARAGQPEPRLIFDVGAHRGESALRFLEAFPTARIFCFEPVPENFRALTEATSAFQCVQCHAWALSDREEQVEIVLQADSQTHTLRQRAGRQPATPRTERILVRTLDATMGTLGVESIDLLKIDTEGYELQVLAGGERTLSSGRVRAVLAEATLDSSDSDHTPLPALVAHLSRLGFQLTSVFDQVLWRRPARLAYFNALFVASR